MARIDELLNAALALVPEKPADDAPQSKKKAYSEKISHGLALAIADELRYRGLKEARPAGEGELGDSGAERRMAGGLGAKKVDVTWATEESGLLFAISVKTVNFKDTRSKNFQKNLVNRRGDMLMEAVTLHRRFPYAVLAGFFFWIAKRLTMERIVAGLLFIMLTTVLGFSRVGTTPLGGKSSLNFSTYSS